MPVDDRPYTDQLGNSARPLHQPRRARLLPSPKLRPATTYAKYIGRVGALAVALGVAGAVATAPGVAWADDDSSTTSGADTSTSDTTSTTTESDPTTATANPTSGSYPDPTPIDQSDSHPSALNEQNPSSQVVATPDDGVIVRSSGGAHTAGEEEAEPTDSEGDPDDSAEAAEDAEDADAAQGADTGDAGEAARAEETPPLNTEGSETTEAVAVTDDDIMDADSVVDSDVSETQSDDDTTATIPLAATAHTDEVTTNRHVLTPAFSLPTPEKVVQQIKSTVTACACGLINGALDLIDMVVAPFMGGGGGAGPGSPALPENPVLAAVLGWARREINRAVDAFSRTPIAQFAHRITTQITQAVADFGNSPLGRQISTQLTQFLEECAGSTSLPSELERIAIVSGLTEPTDFAILADETHPDSVHRIFITEKAGAVKVYDPDTGTVTTLVNLPTVTADGERGLVGIEIDPQFWTVGAEGYHTIYVAYTAADNYDTLSSIKLSDQLQITRETVLLKSTELANNFHHGGELQFDPQGQHLYWAVGDNTDSANAQDLSNIHGKILRLNRDGSAPEDNPFVGEPGAVEQIYALGLRNPFRFTFTPTGALLVGDVGEASWEELNVVTAGSNYGWPEYEGDCGACNYVNPIYAYRHSTPPANAGSITSVVVYTGSAFPSEYQNKVFIADYSVGWIKELTFDSEFSSLISERTFDSSAGATVKLDQGPDGNLYQLNIYPGQLSVIRPSGGNRAPTAVLTSSTPWGAGDSLDVAFSADGSSDPEGQNLHYEWDFGNGQTSTEANPTVTFANTSGDYTAYTVTLKVSDGEKTDTATQRVVVGSTPPSAVIDPMVDNYNAGDTVTFSAQAADDEDGPLPDSAYQWSVVFHHADHVHPFRDNIVGPNGSVTIPRTRDQLGNTFYRVALTVTDRSGLSTTTYKDIKPNVVKLTVSADYPDATITIDGVRYQGSYVEEEAVVGVVRVINAPSPQQHGDSGGQLIFVGWSDGGAQSHTITTPGTDTVITADFELSTSAMMV